MTDRNRRIEECLSALDEYRHNVGVSHHLRTGVSISADLRPMLTALRAALALPEPPATPAWTMQGCPECRGTGKEGTGIPSGEGGEDFRECFRCQGSGFVPMKEGA